MIGQDRAVLAAAALRYFVAFAVAAMGLRSARPGWLRTLGLSTAGAGLAAAPLIIPGAPFYGSILRDWWPLLLVPVAYRAPAGLAGAPRILLERQLLRVDERLAGLTRAKGTPRIPVLDDLLEVAYLLVYPLVPAGLLAFSWSGEASAGDGFWPVLWWAVLPCYASLPVLPTRAPRELAPVPEGSAGAKASVRRLNEGILAVFGNRRNTLPSGHASAAAAIAALLWRVDSPWAPVFVVLAAGIALGAVRGRYHYLVDSVAGAALGMTAGLLL
ncbi:MAG TPA: phosphatase PAP2 family protein [Vicinamibacterales bacterium]